MQPRTRTLAVAALATLLAGCGRSAKSSFHDLSTPENAARSFLEAGRVGDMDSLRASVVAAERKQELHCDYGELERYELRLDRHLDDEHAVVMLAVGPVESPFAVQREQGEWRVTIHGSLQLMQSMLHEQIASSPR